MNSNEVLSKMHSLHLIIADELKRICEKYNITYFMIAGTLLGAVRHQGFIPWDDDMDFGMRRKDYDRFLEIAPSEIDKTKFYLQTADTDYYYTFEFAKLRLKGTTVLEKFSSNVDTEQGIYIDIFPLDVVPENKVRSFIQYKRFWLFRNLLWVKCGYGDDERKRELSYKMIKAFAKPLSINYIKRQKHEIIARYKNEVSSKVVVGDGTYGLKKETLDSDLLNNIVDYPFEDRTYPGIGDFDKYLSYFYGDYMKLPPTNKRNHHGRLEVDFGKYL